MKKFLSILLAVAMMLSVAVLAGCKGGDGAETTANEGENNNEAPAALKFGMGVYADYETPVDADGDNNGTGEVVATVAAVLLDGEGKIVKATVDVADVLVEWTSEGKAVPAKEYLTKREQGDNYGMVNYGVSDKEWYTQADNFCNLIVGKKASDLKALVIEGDKGNDEVVNAGCTIMIADFVYAIEKAAANAVDSEANANSKLAIGVETEVATFDADETIPGSADIEIYVTAAATADGKVVASKTDCAVAAVGFRADGTCTGTTAGISTKIEKGESYGMAAHGQDLNGDGVVKEWGEQAAAFDAACKGKTANEIAALVAADGYYAVEDLQNAGCTMGVSAMVKSAVKAAK